MSYREDKKRYIESGSDLHAKEEREFSQGQAVRMQRKRAKQCRVCKRDAERTRHNTLNLVVLELRDR